MPLLASLELIPTELVFQILSDLTVEDCKSFSLCSKACRDQALPVVFQRIKPAANPIDLADLFSSFKEGGRLAHIRQCVKHAAFYGSGTATIDETVEYYRLFATQIYLLPGLTTLNIGLEFPGTVLNQHPDFAQRLFREIFHGLANNSAAYYTIKRVHMSIQILVSLGMDQLNEESKNFLGLSSTNEASPAVSSTNIWFPPNIEELYFDFTPHMMTSMPLYPLSNVLTARTTLKKVCLNISQRHGNRKREDYGFPDFDFPNVKVLRVHPHFLYDGATLFISLVKLFPGVEDLSVYIAYQMWASNHSVYVPAYDCVSLFQKVRKIRTFWFEEYDDEHGAEFMLSWQLGVIVDRWAKTAQMLENVVFVRSTPRCDHEAVALRIERQETEHWLERKLTFSQRYREERLEFDAS